MALSNLDSLLTELNTYNYEASGSDQAAQMLLDPKTIATDIANLVMSDDSAADIDYASSLLFSPENGILLFLRANSSRDPAITSAQLILLELLASFIPKAQTILQAYAVKIKNCCNAVGSVAASRVRCAAIQVLCVLVDPDKSKLDTSLFDIQGLFDKYAAQLRQPKTKIPSSVKGKILEFLGILVKHYPDLMTGTRGSTLLRYCLATLDDQLSKPENAENALIEGSLLGLNNYLASRLSTVKSGSAESKTISKIVYTTMNVSNDTTRYGVPIAALQLFTNHTYLFDDDIVDNSERTYNYLKKLCSHTNADLYKVAYQALDAFLKQVARMLSQQAPDEFNKKVFNFFMQKFIRQLQADNSVMSSREMSVTIRGIGYFSGACKHYMTAEEMQLLRECLSTRSAWFYSGANIEKDKLFSYIPSFIESYNQFAREMDVIPREFMSSIVNVTSLFAKNCDSMSAYTRQEGVAAIQSLLWTLYLKGEGILRQFVSGFFYDALMFTCTDTAKDNITDQHSYTNFMYFWETLLGQNSQDTSTEDAESLENVKKQHEILFDEFLLALLRLVKTFNLDIRRVQKPDDDETMDTDNQHLMMGGLPNSLEPVNQKDFVLFQNLVDFWCTLLKKLECNRLRQWIHTAGASLVDLSLQKPLVSGFYKMISAVLSVIDKLGIFEGYKSLYEEYQQRKQLDDMYNTPEIQTDTFAAFVIFRDYLKEVWHRLQQFKDELLASCLAVILVYPLGFLDTQELVPPLQSALRLGLTYHPLATIALDAIEVLTDIDAPTSNDPSFLDSLLVILNDYLMLDLKTSENEEVTPKKKFTHTSRKRREIHKKPLAIEVDTAEEYAGLREIQMRVLQFLGRIGGLNKSMVSQEHRLQGRGDAPKDFSISATSNQRDHMLAWDAEQTLNISIPFPNARIQLSFDELLPRICELSLFSPERQVKIAACELLHGLVLYMIGNNAFKAMDTKEPSQSRYHRLYLRIFPVLLKLAIDLDQVARDMFRSLISQLIHWLTNNAQYESPETIALLMSCLNVACSTNAAERDYGAECLLEFVTWSIKQTKESAKEGPVNIKSLLKRLYNLFAHPSATQRLGAAVIFNRIYRIFREEESLVDGFTFELLYYLFYSLRIAENDHPSIGTREQTKEAISHIKRILRVKSSLFLHATPQRRGFPGLEKPDMPSLVAWAFKESGQLQREYAKVAMSLFAEFSLSLPGIESSNQWIQKHVAESPEFLVETFEQGNLDFSDISQDAPLSMWKVWLRHLVCALDGYVWLLERNILEPTQIIDAPNSELFKAIRFMISYDLENALRNFDGQSALERPAVQSLYAYAAYRIVCLSNHLLSNDNNRDEIMITLENTGYLLDDGLIHLVAHMVLLPDAFVDAVHHDQSMTSSSLTAAKIRQTLEQFLHIMIEYGPPKFSRAVAKKMDKIIHGDDVDLTRMDLNRGTFNDMLQLTEGILVLQRVHLLDLVCNETASRSFGAASAYDYCTQLFDKFIQFHMTDEPVWINLLGRMLIVTMNQPGFAKAYAEQLLGFSGVLRTKSYPDMLAFYQKFSIHINSCIASHFKDFDSVLLQHIDMPLTRDIILGLLNYMGNVKTVDKNQVAKFTSDFMSSPFLENIVKEWSVPDHLQDLVAFLKGVFTADPGILLRSKGHPIFEVFCNALFLLLQLKVPLSVKVDVFDLLPIYLTVQGDHLAKIEKAIGDTASMQFPTSTKDLKKGTDIYKNYIGSLNKLLNTMATFHSVMIFRILLPVFIQESDHIYASVIEQEIARFAKGLGQTNFEEVANKCFGYFTDTQLQMHMRLNANGIILSLLSLASDEVVINFYQTHIVSIMSVIKRENLRFGTDEEIIQDLKEKAGCFSLMQVLYQKLPVSQVHGPKSKIAETWEAFEGCAGGGRRMTIDLVGMAHNAKKRKSPSEDANVTLVRRQYYQAAYNAASAAVLRTQNGEKFYIGFLIQDKPSEPLWENIIDTKQKLNFTVELAQPLVKRRIEDLRARSRLQMFSDPVPSSVEYSGLYGSSLSQASLSDMALEVTDAKTEPAPAALPSPPTPEEDAEIGEDIISPDEIEVDQINLNPCMSSLMSVVRKLHTTITPPQEGSTRMPAWMNEMYRVFTSEETHINVRLFLAKLVINCPEAFESYASSWVRPFMRLVLEGQEYGEAMNYFVQDLCVLIIVWGKNVRLEGDNDTFLLSTFLHYLLTNATNESPRVQQNNIQIVKGVFDNWSDTIHVPTKVLHDLFSNRDPASKKNKIGLQFMGVILAHNVNPYSVGQNIEKDRIDELAFYRSVCINMSNKYKDIYADAAEVAGWALNVMRNHKSLNPEIEKMITDKLFSMDPLKHRDQDTTRFIVCLDRIRYHDPPTCEKFVTKVMFLLQQLHGPEKIMALNIIRSCSEDLEDLFQSLEKKNVWSMLKQRNDECQLVLLQLLDKIAQKLSPKQITLVLDIAIPVFPNHSNDECRTLFYSVLKQFYSNLMDTSELHDRIKVQLLRGLVDPKDTIRSDLYAFIQTRDEISNNIYERVYDLLKKAYMPDVENIFLLYCNEMLLDTTKESYDYDKPFFNDPLPNAKFDQNYQNINTHWQRNMSMMPLFVATQQESTMDPEDLESRLRATQNSLAFTPTQAGGRTLLSTFSATPSLNLTLAQSGPQTLSLIDENETAAAQRRKEQTQARQDVYAHLRRRLIKSTARQTSVFFQRREEAAKKRLRQYQMLAKQARDKKVEMYRKYRKGELPDIQIKQSELIIPLQALSRSDNDIARLLFAQLLSTVVKNTGPGTRQPDIKSDVLGAIQDSLKSSTQFYPPAIGSLLRICFELDGDQIDSDLVTVVSERSDNQHLGIMVLEKHLELHDEESSRATKRPKGDTPMLGQKKFKWMSIAMLYKKIDEPEIFESLYEAHVASFDLPKAAIDAEIRGNYRQACNFFVDSIEKYSGQVNSREINLWQQERMSCLEQLAQWDDIATQLNDIVGQDYNSLWEKDSPDMYHFIHSHVKLREGITDDEGDFVPWTESNPNPVYAFIASATENPEKLDMLLLKYPCDISLAAISLKDYDRARYYIRNAYDSFLSDWASLHPLASRSRLSRLADLQRTVELEDFLNMVARIQRSYVPFRVIDKYIRSLLTHYPNSKLDDMRVWDDITSARKIFIEDLEQLLPANMHSALQDLMTDYKKALTLAMATAAHEQNNINVATLCLKNAIDMMTTFEDSCMLRLRLDIQTAMAVENEQQRPLFYARLVSNIHKNQSQLPKDSQFSIEYQLEAAKALAFIRTELQKHTDLYDAMTATSSWHKMTKTMPFKDVDMFATHIVKTGLLYLQDAYRQSVNTSSQMSESEWRLAEYCDGALRQREDESCNIKIKFDSETYAGTVIKYTFRAMNLGNQKAMEQLPRLLDLVERYPESGSIFKENVESFGPVWMCIRWIPQLVAILDTSSAVFVFPMLNKIAKVYPNALYYPFHISKEHYDSLGSKLPEPNRRELQNIAELIRSPLKQEFTNELRRLTNPEHIVKDFIDFIQTVCNQPDIDRVFVENAYRQFSGLILEPRNSRLGSIPKAFASKHASSLREMFGRDGAKLLKITSKDLAKILRYYQKEIQNQKPSGPTDLLKSYSPWLASFQGANFDESIEVPGQYSGLSQPHPEYHARISSIDERLLVMSSLRKPKRLKLYGTDEKEYLFLLKGGEDLRLDQRIQQLFGVMNVMLLKNPFCVRQNIYISTYKVVPMSTNIGMIEWVDNTKPLRLCIEEQAKGKTAFLRAQEAYRVWVQRFKGDVMGYHQLFHAPRAEVVKHFEMQQNQFNPSLLRNYLFKLAASPEAFLFLRKGFIHSLSAICISGYILGIGDRHLENFLVDLKTGRMISIDFGHAFGSATELLPVPELIPFRLTRQLVGVLEPLGVDGVLEVSMTNVMQAIQAQKDLLLNIMDVFIKEPLLDWKKIALKQAKNQRRGGRSQNTRGSNDSSVDESSEGSPSGSSSSHQDELVAWYPQKKLANARRKLSLVNPANIIVDELASGHTGKPYLKPLQSIAKGDRTHNIRARVEGEICESTRQQVQCLIDVATDPNVLGRMWVGWQPYV